MNLVLGPVMFSVLLGGQLRSDAIDNGGIAPARQFVDPGHTTLQDMKPVGWGLAGSKGRFYFFGEHVAFADYTYNGKKHVVLLAKESDAGVPDADRYLYYREQVSGNRWSVSTGPENGHYGVYFQPVETRPSPTTGKRPWQFFQNGTLIEDNRSRDMRPSVPVGGSASRDRFVPRGASLENPITERSVLSPPITANYSPQVDSAASPTEPVDYAKLVAAFKNANPAPTLTGQYTQKVAHFAAGHDRKKSQEVVDAVTAVVGHVDEAFPALVEHLDDRSYAMTVNLDDWIYNYSVARICTDIIFQTLDEAYQKHIPRGGFNGGETRLRYFLRPQIHGVADFKTWYQEQVAAGRTVWELQVAAAEWAIEEVQKLDDATEEEKQTAIAGIQKEIDHLRETKKAIMSSRYWSDGRAPMKG
jgi:hypothetical protein